VKLRTEDHFPSCNPNYPEKTKGEPAQALQRIDLVDDEWVDICVDCGATIRASEPKQ